MMNIEEYCQSILFGNSLKEKLHQCEVTLSTYEAISKTPKFPGRPAELSLDINKAMSLPSVHQLENRTNRGLLLHFFLNHELLALEIMAMVLLKFPDLPDSFKRTLLKTMKDEQKHASLYIDSMKSFGVEPGEMGVNGFFWDCFKDITDPREFITGMSLTFEQANLDFSLYYKKAFETVGDLKTAAVLDEVYQDEISHVSSGLKWFRKWKKPGVSDWQHYVSSLKLPLSPGRAKGNVFDREGRIKAGFDEDFIDRLEVTSFSRGRSPDVYLFNAFSESYIAQGLGFNIPQWGIELQNDLSILPLVFAGKDDILLLSAKTNVKHLAKLMHSGFELPQIIDKEIHVPVKPLVGRHPGKMRPWGWSPAMQKTLQPLMKQQHVAQSGWHEDYKPLFSKNWSIHLLAELSQSGHHWFKKQHSIICHTLLELDEAFKIFLAEGHKTLAVKSPFGASGRGIFRFPNGEIDDNQRGRLKNILKKQDSLIVEPWLDRIADFSAHYQVEDGVKFLGISRLINDNHGQYSASLFGRTFHGLGAEVMKFFQEAGDKGINDFYVDLSNILEEKLAGSSYKGPLGVDFFLYKDFEGKVAIRPIVETNFRYTMGRLSLQLEKKLAPGKSGLFKIFSLLSVRERELHQKLVEYKDTVLSFNSRGQWESGVCQLNEWHEKLKFPIFISVAQKVEDCFTQLGLNVQDIKND